MISFTFYIISVNLTYAVNTLSGRFSVHPHSAGLLVVICTAFHPLARAMAIFSTVSFGLEGVRYSAHCVRAYWNQTENEDQHRPRDLAVCHRIQPRNRETWLVIRSFDQRFVGVIPVNAMLCAQNRILRSIVVTPQLRRLKYINRCPRDVERSRKRASAQVGLVMSLARSL